MRACALQEWNTWLRSSARTWASPAASGSGCRVPDVSAYDAVATSVSVMVVVSVPAPELVQGAVVQVRFDGLSERAGGARSVVAGEAEVDLRLARLGPTRGHDLGARVEVHRLGAVDVRVAEERVLPAAERVGADRHGDRHVDADHPDLDVELEPASRSTVAREDRHAVREPARVDELDGILVGLDTHDREHRTEDLVLVHLHAGRHV